jgi:cellulose synthase/poly-beta-1,6-N-acetylglucosamine synthase-like glycosyltransferase
MNSKGILKKQPSRIPSNASKPPLVPPPPPPTVVFGRRTDSGRFISYSRDDLDSEISSVDMDYHVNMPMTPDHDDSMDDMDHHKQEDQYTGSIFTGGFNAATRAHVLPNSPSRGGHVQMSNGRSICMLPGCDGKIPCNNRGEDILPCDCEFKICIDCFNDSVKSEGGICPGCKEMYKNTSWEDVISYSNETKALSLPSSMGPGKHENSLVQQSNHNQGGEFDHNRWLFETKGTYGYGNAIWTDDNGDDDNGNIPGEPKDLVQKPWRPLTRKLKVPAGILSPYRLLVLLRVVVLALFLMWRIKHVNQDAVWLWFMSIICELWFALSWLLDQLPKLCPINRATDLSVLKEKFETPRPNNPTGKSDLPGLDIFVSTADPEKEPVLVTANTILSILAADYPVEKLACYVSDDGGALLTFEAMAEAASFAQLWVPFCKKHKIEPRNPDSYFNHKRDPFKNKVKSDFVKDRRRIKREYDEYKVRVNGLPDAIRRRSDAYHAREEIQAMNQQREKVKSGGDEMIEPIKIAKATWMADGTHWPGTWLTPSQDHSRSDHAGIIQVMLKPAADMPIYGRGEKSVLDFHDVDIRLPMLVYMSREKRPGYDHNKKAGAMNALVRASAILSNGPFILNLDCDHYVYNSLAFREGLCFMLDRGGDRLCYVQFPQRFEGIDPSDRYANHNTVFFDINMRALDGLQGPVYVGTGCLFRRVALYGFDPPRSKDHSTGLFSCCLPGKRKASASANSEETTALRMGDFDNEDMNLATFPKKFGNSSFLIDSIPVAEFQGRPLADHPSVKNGRPPGALTVPREMLDASIVAEAISVISCWYFYLTFSTTYRKLFVPTTTFSLKKLFFCIFFWFTFSCTKI